MRLRRLDLLAFGPFTDLSLDLSAGSFGLHLIHGPNEAGKSSTLRAIHNLFYGIPLRSNDNFLHEHNQMCLGAEIENRAGNVLAFQRRKKNKNALTALDDSATPIEPETLDRFLGGVDEDTFRALFGIDHHRLVEGGKAILEGKGQVGQLLFAAGSGLTGLKAATGTLQKELDDLFKPRGQNPEINRLLSELAALRKQVQESQLPSDEWTRHHEALRDALHAKEEFDLTRQDRSRARNRLLRIQSAKKPIAERDEFLTRFEELADVVPLPEDFADRHRSARESLTRALALAEQAKMDRDALAAALETIAVPDELLAQGECIESLYQRLGAHLLAQEHRPGIRAQQTSDEHYARNLLVELGKPRDLEQAAALRLRGDEPDLIRGLGREHASIETSLDRHRQAFEAQVARLEELTEELDAIGPEPDIKPLRRVVQRCRKLGDPEEELRTFQSAREQEQRALQRARQGLPHWDGSLEELVQLRPPLDETIAEASQAVTDHTQRMNQLERDLATVTADLDAVEVQIRTLTLEHDMPTEADLAASRTRRDEGWQLVRRSWLDQAAPTDETVAFIAEFAPGGSLDGAFERSLLRADEQADRLRREADRAATLANHLAHREKLNSRRADLQHAKQQVADAVEQLRHSWADRLRTLGLPDRLGPEELRAWLRRREAIVEAVEALRLQDEQIESLQRTIAESRDAIASALPDGSESKGIATESLADRLERAEAVIAEVEERRTRREETRKNLQHARRERDEAERRLLESTRHREQWHARWEPLMARIGLEPEDTPAQADQFLDRIDKLFAHLDKARGFKARIDGIDRDAREFAHDVAEVCRAIAPDLVERPVETAVAELYRRLGEARDLRKHRETTRQNCESAVAKLRAAEQTILQEQARLDTLCQEARCDSADELPEAEARAADRSRVESELRRVEDQIRDLSAGASLEEFIAEAKSVDADEIDLLLQELDTEIDEIEQERSRLDQTIGGEREWLRSQQGGDDAALAAERTQSLLAELRSKVEDYAALRIATELLHRGIEQFREEHQGPVIRRAGELFAELTSGSFQGLDFDEDDHGRPVLLGVRNGQRVGVEAMSDGSCDQLYLALRLASLEGWLDRHEPIPLIADDILLNFDDERSAAALRALAELSRRTQILFFTHHEHLVELAQSSLPADVLFLHLLERSAVSATA
ncbi:ATP-binding protein [Tautonia marina]|uniref:ATP-binding protein n=1 Tax=Tautonia marina TaxID=2653855 RepID=UPI0012610186|nr:YhaN family protein [Tautonia marina]